jgi:hypothetical protein
MEAISALVAMAANALSPNTRSVPPDIMAAEAIACMIMFF